MCPRLRALRGAHHTRIKRVCLRANEIAYYCERAAYLSHGIDRQRCDRGYDAQRCVLCPMVLHCGDHGPQARDLGRREGVLRQLVGWLVGS